MRTRKIRQQELFDENTAVRRPLLQEELRNELLQLLTQWLYTLGERMVQEGSDE
jgi:hypothetical protein